MQSKHTDAHRPFSIIPFGAGGTGKSNLLNMLVGMEGRFKSSKTCASGETKNISFEVQPAFGKQGNKMLKVFDAPGVGDMELSLHQIVADIKASIGHEQIFDAALIVIKIFDYRATVQEVIALKAIKNFFENFSPKQVFCIVTHCDLQKPDEETVSKKIESFKKWGGFEVSRENVIFFDNTPESLYPFIDKLSVGNMTVAENIEDRCKIVLSELGEDFKRQDQEEGTKNSREFMELLSLMHESNREFIKLMADQHKSTTELLVQMANKPPVIIERGMCSIF